MVPSYGVETPPLLDPLPLPEEPPEELPPLPPPELPPELLPPELPPLPLPPPELPPLLDPPSSPPPALVPPDEDEHPPVAANAPIERQPRTKPSCRAFMKNLLPWLMMRRLAWPVQSSLSRERFEDPATYNGRRVPWGITGPTTP